MIPRLYEPQPHGISDDRTWTDASIHALFFGENRGVLVCTVERWRPTRRAVRTRIAQWTANQELLMRDRKDVVLPYIYITKKDLGNSARAFFPSQDRFVGSCVMLGAGRRQSWTGRCYRWTLELIAERKLHYAGGGEQAAVISERPVIEGGGDALDVKTRQVEEVVDVPAELQGVGLAPRHSPALGQADVEAGKAISAQ
jgi:hypothetical protein